ncbi:MAG: DUF3438 family protein [Methylococcaceae bacterium]|nr:DUF3438 family protein [Methylococcaceae bacterium]
MKTFYKLAILFTLVLGVSATHGAPKRMIYTGNPLSITLGINEERRLTFPDAKIVWGDISDKLKDDGALKVEIINNNVYLRALKPFKNTRNVFGKEGGSDVYLFDIKATQAKTGSQRLIIVKGEDRYAVSDKDKKVEPETVIAPLKSRGSPTSGYATMFKYVAREIYAPDRLRGGSKGIYRESVNKRAVYHLLRDNQVITKPVGAWRSGSLHITAISVENITNRTITLDPRNIRGFWKASLFHSPRILAKGSPMDNTTLYLVSNETFAEVVSKNPMIKVGRR